MSKMLCKHCGNAGFVKNGFMSGKQRYKCKKCSKTFTAGDKRERYDDAKRFKVMRMYLEGVGIRSIERLEDVSNVLVIQWIRKFSKLIKRKLFEAAENIDVKKDISVMEIDELVTWIKKNREEIKKQKNSSVENTPSYGLLLIGKDLKLLTLR